MNIRFKITLLFTLLVTGILSLINYSVYYFTERNRAEIFKVRLRGGTKNRIQLFTYLGDSSTSVFRKLDSNAIIAIPKRANAIFDNHNNRLYEFHAPDLPAIAATGEMLARIRRGGESFFPMGELTVCGISYNVNKRNYVILYAGIDEEGEAQVHALKQVLLFSMLGGVVITLLVGFIFSSELVKPINRLIGEVNEISSSNLSHRIYTSDRQDELARLANTFNDLLDRLEDSFNIQRRFISNASHELSTPLTSISSQLQVTLQKERNSAEYQQVLHSIQEDVEQMRQLTKSLLEIAKTGYQGGIELSEVRIDEIMLKIVLDVKKLNASYDVDLDFGEFPDDEKSCLAYGNTDLLYSALRNITENGCKYSPDKRSFVLLQFKDKNIIIQVKNKGDIITEEEIDHVFQPFYRASNAGDTKGFGLGLALSKRIIGLHKGSITVESDIQTGTIFTIVLPSLSAYYQ